MSQVLTLYRLQQTDSHIDFAQARLDSILKSLEEDDALKFAIQIAESKAYDLQNYEIQQNKLDSEVSSLRIKLEQTESNLYGDTKRNPKELQDLQNETAAIKRYLLLLEDKLLEAMAAVEDTQIQNDEAQRQLSITKGNWSEQSQNLNQERLNLLKDIEKLNIERLAITKSVAPDQIKLYEQLRKQRQGLAVSSIQETRVLHAVRTLTLALVQAARSSGQISHCPTCGRFLYGS